MKRAATLVLLVLGCGGAPSATPPLAAVRPPVLPRRSELTCFPCHSQLKFEKGPAFPHALAAHRAAGHCHVCHLGSGHHGRQIDGGACLTCHEAGSPQLARLASRDTTSK